MTDRTASPNTLAFRDLPADIQEYVARTYPYRPMSHMEIMLAIGQEIARERERCTASQAGEQK